MTRVRLWTAVALTLGAAQLASAAPDTRAIAGQGQQAAQSAEALAHLVRERVDAAARQRPGNTAAMVPRTRAFYDIIKAEPINMAAEPGPVADDSTDVAVVARGANLLAQPGGTSILRVEGGAKGTVLEEQSGWRKLIVDDGSIGWVRAVDLAPTRHIGPVGPLTADYFEALAASIAYPENASTAEGIRRMASGRVNAEPNRCAASMREALGWGLGDAHRWASGLPRKGFVQRPPDEEPQPGDILVWPFTFGADGSQHVGFAVEHNGEVMLLSNLSGRIRLSEVLPGHAAFAP